LIKWNLEELSKLFPKNYFEAGYAKALKKKIIVIHQEGTEANFLEAAADIIITYKDFEDLREKLKKIKK